MKRPIILLALLCSIFHFSGAQNYYTLPDSNAHWVFSNGSIGIVWTTNLFTSTANRDTIINSNVYTKVFNDSNDYSGAYRSETTGKAYFIYPDSLQEYLFMDLSKNAGDSVKNIYVFASNYGFHGLIDLFVDSVDYQHVGPYILKRLYLSNNILFPGVYPKLTWIEKIGTSDGFKNYLQDNVVIGENLKCMYYNDTTYYSWYFVEYSPGYCTSTGDINNASLPGDFIIFPNPSSDEITIDNLSQKTIISFCNLQGQLLFQKTTHERKTEIDISEFAKGIYLLILKNDKTNNYIKIIKE